MNSFENKRIFIAPYTPTSKAFEKYLSLNINIVFKGFIDKNKIGKNIFKINEIKEIFDYIIIISPNHSLFIYEDCEVFFEKNKLRVIDIVKGKYILNETPQKNKNNIKYYSELIDKQNTIREGVVFICKGFIDSNNKYFFLYCLSRNIDATIITDNINQLNILKKHQLPCLLLESEEGDKKVAQAKYIVFDQADFTYLFISKDQITIQLWHGVGLKKMSKQNNIIYDFFISTSNWTNDSNFKNIFLSKNYLNLGYPRNDIFFKKEEDKDMIFCDKDIFSIVKNRKFNKVILYMPTYREYIFNKDITLDKSDFLPLNFSELNKELLSEGILFIIKFHPCIMEILGEVLKEQKFENIIFHPTQGDIYPIIKYVDILVTDYSSIAYDFLLLDRPIIFFDYDRENYEKNMGGFLFDYDEYSPGIKVKNQEELICAIKEKDCYSQKREEIKDLFFDSSEFLACENIFNHVIKEKV